MKIIFAILLMFSVNAHAADIATTIRALDSAVVCVSGKDNASVETLGKRLNEKLVELKNQGVGFTAVSQPSVSNTGAAYGSRYEQVLCVTISK